MKNLKYFPFERNRYFYGKLLTVDDFETEQKYMNDKRRMINRFLHGYGVVCGMNVVRVDDATVSVEMGLALDFSGREIVIDTPVIKKLSMVEGFHSGMEDEGEAGYYYLCVEYSEAEKEAVHSISSSDARSQNREEYNKYAEGYHMFLTSQEPENRNFMPDHFYTDTRTVYWGNGVRIKQVVPKFARSGSNLELNVIVENMGQQQQVSFDYDLDLTCLQSGGSRKLHVSFNEKDYESAKRYKITYPLDVMAVKDEEGVLSVDGRSFALHLGGRQVFAEVGCKSVIGIVDGNAKREVMNRYYRTAMEEIVKNTYQQAIYLAKIAVIRAGSTYIIENIEQMPFGQYVLNNTLAAAIGEMEMREIESLQSRAHGAVGPEPAQKQPAPLSVYIPPAIATGSIVIDMGIGGAQGQGFASDNITHGLGLGPVTVILGQAYQVDDNSDILFGDAEVFVDAQMRGIPEVTLAAKVNVRNGTFVIGVMMRAPTNVRKLRVQWTVLRDQKDSMDESRTKRIHIEPDVTDIEVRDSVYFKAVLSNVSDQRVRWSIKEPEGGSINQNGMYTAPNLPGVYEIACESVSYPDLRASTYVMVRETRADG